MVQLAFVCDKTAWRRLWFKINFFGVFLGQKADKIYVKVKIYMKRHDNPYDPIVFLSYYGQNSSYSKSVHQRTNRIYLNTTFIL